MPRGSEEGGRDTHLDVAVDDALRVQVGGCGGDLLDLLELLHNQFHCQLYRKSEITNSLMPRCLLSTKIAFLRDLSGSAGLGGPQLGRPRLRVERFRHLRTTFPRKPMCKLPPLRRRGSLFERR